MGQVSDIILGPNVFPTVGSGTAPATISWTGGIFVNSGKIFVTDFYNHRIIRWDSIPSASGAFANAVLGQANYVNNKANTGGISPYAYNLPLGVMVSGHKFYVADYGNNRVIGSLNPTE